MNVEIGAEAAQFPEKEYKNGIVFAVCVLWDAVGSERKRRHEGVGLHKYIHLQFIFFS
jgi:hypothetical protein